jgi:peptidoglycan/xylan/chitin deacetylase (PgdA/CDA1 family)
MRHELGAERHPLPDGFRWPDGVRAAALFSFDLDAEAVMLADHPGVAGFLDVIAHQRYGPRAAVPRLLRLLDRARLRTTFFIPGWVAETWPDVARSVRDAGHEIGHHGYLHESVRGVDEATEVGYLDRGLAALDEVLGVRPIGYRAPSWDMNFRTPRLLAAHGFRYDSGLMDADHPYRLATSLEPAAPTLVELPVHWSLDDWNRYNYVPGLTGTGVIGRPSQVCDAWAEDLDAIVDVGGLFNLTMHPFVSGRPARAAALERLIERAAAIDGLWLAAGDEIAAWVEGLDLPAVHHEPPPLR